MWVNNSSCVLQPYLPQYRFSRSQSFCNTKANEGHSFSILGFVRIGVPLGQFLATSAGEADQHDVVFKVVREGDVIGVGLEIGNFEYLPGILAVGQIATDANPIANGNSAASGGENNVKGY